MLATMKQYSATAPRTIDWARLSVEEYRRVRPLIKPVAVADIRPGDVRYMGAREIHSPAGVEIRHVFQTVENVTRYANGTVEIDGARFFGALEIDVIARGR